MFSLANLAKENVGLALTQHGVPVLHSCLTGSVARTGGRLSVIYSHDKSGIHSQEQILPAIIINSSF